MILLLKLIVLMIIHFGYTIPMVCVIRMNVFTNTKRLSVHMDVMSRHGRVEGARMSARMKEQVSVLKGKFENA